MPRSRACMPMLGQVPVRLDDDERARLARIARRVVASDPALSADRVAPGVRRGSAGPALLVEDRSEIGLMRAQSHPSLAYRSLLLAEPGDLVLVDCTRDPDFETYCRDQLKLGPVDVLSVPGEGDPGACTPICHRCLEDPDLLAKVVTWARGHGEITLLPYIGTANVWMLAATIAGHAGVPVRVAAPMPSLAQHANDKLWFSQRISEVLGPGALPPGHSVFGPEALARQVAALAPRHWAVVVKVPDSAGSLGNVRVDATAISGLSEPALRERLLDDLDSRGWRNEYPLFLSVWETSVLGSPSAQLWIPEPGEPPRLQGLFAQITTDGAGRFAGARPLDLPEPWPERIATEALRLAHLLQELGYFGPCSFDAVLVGPSTDAADLHWIECNGRWGGVSIPLALADRLTGDWRSHPFVVVQDTMRPVPERRFAEVLACLEGHLFRPGEREDGIVLLTPTPFTGGFGLHFMALGASVAQAEADAKTASILLGDGAL